MDDILKWVGKAFSFAFAALVIGYTATLTFMVAGRLVPGNLLLQVMTVMLFDGAALIWFIQFITQARATAQWAIAGIGFSVGLVGAVIMAAGELILGQSLVTLSNPERLGWVLITSVIAACVIHVLLIYLYHFMDPGVRNRIEMETEVAKQIAQAHADARSNFKAGAVARRKAIQDTVSERAMLQLEMEAGVHQRERNRQAMDISKVTGQPPVLDGNARDAPLVTPFPGAAQSTPRPVQPISAPPAGGNGHGPASAAQGAARPALVVPVKEAQRGANFHRPPSSSNRKP